jgi:transcriptional regulator with XRE-family HTH domain
MRVESSPEIAARIEGRLERLGITAEEADAQAGLPPGTVAAILGGTGGLPRGDRLRRLAAALDVGEEFVLGLEPGDLVPAAMLEDPQGELGLLAPDEEALLRNYRRLDIPGRAAVNLLVARAAGAEADPQPEKAPARPRTPRRAQGSMPLGG